MSSLRISDLAQQAHVPVSTVRYRERTGLLDPPERLDNGYRVYEDGAAGTDPVLLLLDGSGSAAAGVMLAEPAMHVRGVLAG